MAFKKSFVNPGKTRGRVVWNADERRMVLMRVIRLKKVSKNEGLSLMMLLRKAQEQLITEGKLPKERWRQVMTIQSAGDLPEQLEQMERSLPAGLEPEPPPAPAPVTVRHLEPPPPPEPQASPVQPAMPVLRDLLVSMSINFLEDVVRGLLGKLKEAAPVEGHVSELLHTIVMGGKSGNGHDHQEPPPKHNPQPFATSKENIPVVLVCGVPDTRQQSAILSAAEGRVRVKFWTAEPSQSFNSAAFKDKARAADRVIFSLGNAGHMEVETATSMGKKILRVPGAQNALIRAVDSVAKTFGR